MPFLLKQGADFLEMLVGQKPKEIGAPQQIEVFCVHSLGGTKNFQSTYLLSNSLKQRSTIRLSRRARISGSCRDGSVRVFTRQTSKASPRGMGSNSVPAFTLKNRCCCSTGTSSSKTSLWWKGYRLSSATSLISMPSLRTQATTSAAASRESTSTVSS